MTTDASASPNRKRIASKPSVKASCARLASMSSVTGRMPPGAMAAGAKMAVMAADALTVKRQVDLPVQGAPSQPVNTLPGPGVAVSVRSVLPLPFVSKFALQLFAQLVNLAVVDLPAGTVAETVPPPTTVTFTA
ncbi:MAG: hypothetical protein IPI73_26090 [Betaproteobacteria bacterium]|nr:hypothetical protein [Betaproteobacteria bacterium]